MQCCIAFENKFLISKCFFFVRAAIALDETQDNRVQGRANLLSIVAIPHRKADRANVSDKDRQKDRDRNGHHSYNENEGRSNNKNSNSHGSGVKRSSVQDRLTRHRE